MLSITLSGLNEAECDGISHTETFKRGPVAPLCRRLIEAGYDPEKEVVVRRGQTTVFHTATLGWWASQQVTEADGASPKFKKHTPWRPAE